MQTEQFFDLLLDFGADWQVAKVESCDITCDVDIYLEYVGPEKPYDYAPPRRWRHLNTMQYQTFLSCRLPRFKTAGGEVKTLTPPWAEKHERFTQLFESEAIKLLLATQNQTRTAKLLGCAFDVVHRIMLKATARGLARRDQEEVIEELSVDEKSFRKGHSYATILSDPQTGRVLEVEEDRTLAACRKLFDKALTGKQRAGVKKISMDMWQAYQTAAREKLPEALIAHDKFHLIGYLSEAIDKVRRREVKAREELKQSRYALLKNEENLTEKQREKFAQIMAGNFEVSRAWTMRENFRAAFENVSREASEAIFWSWHEAAQASGLKEVIKVAEMFASHLCGVLEAMTGSLSNALAERLNGKIQLLKSIGRGYRQFENFRGAILFFYGQLDLFPLNSQ